MPHLNRVCILKVCGMVSQRQKREVNYDDETVRFQYNNSKFIRVWSYVCRYDVVTFSVWFLHDAVSGQTTRFVVSYHDDLVRKLYSQCLLVMRTLKI